MPPLLQSTRALTLLRSICAKYQQQEQVRFFPHTTTHIRDFLTGSGRSFNYLEMTLAQLEISAGMSTPLSLELAPMHSSATGPATATFPLSNSSALGGTLLSILSLYNSLSLFLLINSLSLSHYLSHFLYFH